MDILQRTQRLVDEVPVVLLGQRLVGADDLVQVGVLWEMGDGMLRLGGSKYDYELMTGKCTHTSKKGSRLLDVIYLFERNLMNGLKCDS